MPRPPRLHTWNIFLLKEHLSERHQGVKDPDALAASSVSSLDGTLYVKPPRSGAPWWADFLEPSLDDPSVLANLRNASSSGVLVVNTSNRLFALTFGYGRSLLDPESYERDFGLKVVLNAVEASQIRSLDTKSFDDLTMHTRRDASQGSEIETFGLDVSRDLVRAVTGVPRDETLGTRVSGAESLSIRSRSSIQGLPDLLGRVLEHYEDDRYKERFAWVDRLRAVSDPSKIVELQDSLLSAIRSRSLTDLHLAPPEPLDWSRVDGFRFSTDPSLEESYTDPPISKYLDSIEQPEEISVEQLKKDRVWLYISDNPQPAEKWPVYRCLVFETRIDDRLYALSGGRWFSVDNGFVDEVTRYVEGLPDLDLELPEAALGETEGDYNSRVGRELGDVISMDSDLVRLEGRDPVELCDLLHRDKKFIHVKKRGGSSTLSHLFFQGLNSAEMLLRDSEFRSEARNKVRSKDPGFEDAVPFGAPGPEQCEVSFVVITRSSRSTPLTLPFFSLVSLRNAARDLRERRFRVSKLAVREREP